MMRQTSQKFIRVLVVYYFSREIGYYLSFSAIATTTTTTTSTTTTAIANVIKILKEG